MRLATLLVLLLSLAANAQTGRKPLPAADAPSTPLVAAQPELVERTAWRPRTATLIAGAATVLAAWTLTQAASLDLFCGFRRPACEGSPAVGFIPVAGALMLANQHFLPAWAGTLSAVTQGIGLFLVLIGALPTDPVLVKGTGMALELSSSGVTVRF